MAEEIGDDVLKVRPHLESWVPKEFPSAMHYVKTIITVVLEDEKVRISLQPKDSREKTEKAQAAVARKIATYEGLLQATHDELKKADHALTICTAPDALIMVKTLEEENEVHK
ncbi:hypothetical protein KI387_019030, partial [Taxus chinensis]